ncbi:MAG: polysaccharide biosynthesis tyrosine autokinase [Desulfobacterales bacterium]|nr:MAG: polysaccharide biosynthesis tyrosine autokinase [Desulfobacterales bacterium]
MAQYDVDLRDYWRIIRKRKASIIFMVVLVAICSYGFAKFKEPVPLYKATAAIKIDRSAQMASYLTGPYWLQWENMETRAYIIKSFPVLAKAAKLLEWIPKDLSAEAIRNNRKYLAVIERLESKVEAEHQEGTNIIDIRAVSQDPREATMAANAVAQAYREYNIHEKNKKTFETKNFIEEQLRLTSVNLKGAERELQAFKEGYALISLDAQTQNTLDRLNAVETEYEKVKVQSEEVASQLRNLDNGKKGTTGKFKRMFLSAPPDSPVYGLKTKLSELFLKRRTLLINLTEKHPQVREIDDQIQAVIQETKKELNSLLRTYKAREKDLLEKIGRLREENQRLPEKALQLVRLQREVDLQASLYSQLKEKYQETLIQESSKVEEVSIVKPAVPSTQPYNVPSKLMIITTGIAMGFVVGLVFAFLVEVFDTSMGTIEDVEELLEVPVLGVIPFLQDDDKRKERTERRDPARTRMRDLVTHFKPESMGAEAFRALRTNLQFLRLETKGKVFLITSSFLQEGKTLNVVNLALTMAQGGNKVLLIDADLRKPLVHKTFGLAESPGLTDYVLGNYQWKEICNTISDVMLGDFGIDNILINPGMDNLHIITAGTKPPNPSEILSSTRFGDFLKKVEQDYHFIFIDAPPILPVADASEIATLVDGVFLVYKVGKIGRGVLKRVKSNLKNVNAKLVGVILNNVKSEEGPEYYRYHSYYYGHESKSNKEYNIKSLFKKIDKSKIHR